MLFGGYGGFEFAGWIWLQLVWCFAGGWCAAFPGLGVGLVAVTSSFAFCVSELVLGGLLLR